MDRVPDAHQVVATAREKPVFIIDDDTDTLDYSDNDVDLLAYVLEATAPEVITIADNGDDTAEPAHVFSQQHVDISPPDVEEQKYTYGQLTVFAGSTVELKTHAGWPADQLHSGDFLRVRHIIHNLETDEVRLRGWQLRRTKYCRQMVNWKLNELVLILSVDKNGVQHPLEEGMIDVPITEVFRVRECIMTDKPYPLLSWRDNPPAYGMSNDEYRKRLFHQGRLVCRLIHILHTQANGKSYSGVFRQLYFHEADKDSTIWAPPVLVLDEDLAVVTSPTSVSNRKRSRSTSFNSADSVEVMDREARKRPQPTARVRYTFGDVFSGAGGASQGAKQAGMIVTWGLDHDENAIEAFGWNHPGALLFCTDAHHFPPEGSTKNMLRVDILHLSPPCSYWSPAHTQNGPNDQANYEAIYTVGPILKKCKPRIVTLEQTFGLFTHNEHKRVFKMLLRDIHLAGYNLRYRIVDMSEFGVPQQRQRLLIIASRKGTPLPPFPRATHGSAGSGLKRKVSVADALQPLERLGRRAFEDPYHQPDKLRSKNEAPYDPETSLLKGCVTTGGGENYHYSGSRAYTPREASLFQSFPYGYMFTGSKTEAMKQIGNAFPPVMAEALYRSAAKTLEAYDSGLIEAEEDIDDDVDAYLERKEAFNLPRSSYRYLSRPTVASNLPRQSVAPLFSRQTHIEPAVLDASQELSRHWTTPSIQSRERRRVREEAMIAEEDGDLIILDDD